MIGQDEHASLLVLDHMGFEYPAIVTPFGKIETAICIQAIDCTMRCCQGMMRIVVREQTLPAERQQTLETFDPLVHHGKIAFEIAIVYGIGIARRRAWRPARHRKATTGARADRRAVRRTAL